MSFLRKDKGFTLVELAISIVIVGLLIGGLLKGKELNENTRINGTIRQIQSFDAATTTFRDDYGAWPGDITDPDKRLPDCHTLRCRSAGNGDGYVDVLKTLEITKHTPSEKDERTVFWHHLGVTKLISGIQLDAPWSGGTFGIELPKAEIGGGFTISGYKVPAEGIYKNIAGNYLRLWAQNDPILPVLNGRKAHLFDNKMDDGKPGTGDMLASGKNCAKGEEYNDANRNLVCIAYIRLQNDNTPERK